MKTLLLGMLPVLALAEPTYTIQNLGSTAVNTLVVTIGLSPNASWAAGSQNPSWVWHNGSGMTSLSAATGTNWQEARGINNSGAVVGYSTPFDPIGQQALYWDGSTLKTFKPAGSSSAQAWGVTNSGLVGGMAVMNSGGGRIFVWDPVTNTSAILSSNSVINGMTDSGSMSGFNAFGAIRVDGGLSGLTLTQLDLPTGASYARGLGLNDTGAVVGYNGFSSGSATNAILWNGTAATVLAGLSGSTQNRAQDINNAGDIVGQSGNKAVLWHSGLVYDLSLLVSNPIAGVQLLGASAISENGSILVQGRDADNRIRGYLLTPEAPPVSATPEPASFALACLGAAVFVLRKRRT